MMALRNSRSRRCMAQPVEDVTKKQSSTQTKCDMHDNEHQGKWAFAVSHFFLCCFSLLYARSLSLPFTHFSCVFLSLSSALPPPFQLNVICMNC